MPTIESKSLSDQSFEKLSDPDSIQVFRRKEELPKGLFFYQDRFEGKPRIKLFASPDYPSANAPHIVIAAMAASGPVNSRQKTKLETEYRRRASEKGANALYFSANPNIVFAIRLSDTPVAAASVSKEPRSFEGYKRLGKAQVIDLGQAKLSLPTEKARCYAMTVVLDDGAALNQDASHGLYIELKSSDRLLGNRSLRPPSQPIDNPEGLKITAPRHGSFLHLRSFSNEIGCASGKNSAALRLWTMGNSSAIGSGTLRVQFFEKKIANAKLSKLLVESDARWEQARIVAQEQRIRQDRADLARRESDVRDRERKVATQATKKYTKTPVASTYFSMSLHNKCSHSLKLFVGTKPKYGSGTTSTIGSNTISSYSGTAGQMFWLVDNSGNGLSSYVASAGSQRVIILPSCSGFSIQ